VDRSPAARRREDGVTVAPANRRLLLARRPATTARLQDEDFVLDDAPLPALADGEVLVGVDTLGFDPAQRGWLRDEPSYVAPVQVGETMRASGAGVVLASRDPLWAQGARVTGMLGWQTHASGTPEALHLWRVPDGVSSASALGVLGTTGLTAYFGLFEIGRVAAGDTVLVSAAAGATGSVAGQLARMSGARVIGIAGGPEKCAWLTGVAGFDAAIDHRNDDVAERLGELAPCGIDVFYDNVGGTTLDAGLLHLAHRARVVICGAISTRYAEAGAPSPGVHNLARLLVARATMEGFIVLDFADRHAQARDELAGWLRDGRLVAAEDVQRGPLEAAPATLRRLFEGRNLGKQLLKLHDATTTRTTSQGDRHGRSTDPEGR
jgi:NADPH-dependent curcumin reductase CurA